MNSLGVFSRISEALGTNESIRNRLRANTENALVADFIDTTFYAVEGRSNSIQNKDTNVDIVYCIVLVNVLEMFTITLDLLLKRKGTAAHLDKIVNHLWMMWLRLDVAMNLCPSQQAWKPPMKALEIVEAMRKELAQSVT